MQAQHQGNQPLQQKDKQMSFVFSTIVVYTTQHQNHFVLGRVQRMRKKEKRGYIEYIQPVSLDDRPTDVEILYTKYNPKQDKYEIHEGNTFHTPFVCDMRC